MHYEIAALKNELASPDFDPPIPDQFPKPAKFGFTRDTTRDDKLIDSLSLPLRAREEFRNAGKNIQVRTMIDDHGGIWVTHFNGVALKKKTRL